MTLICRYSSIGTAAENPRRLQQPQRSVLLLPYLACGDGMLFYCTHPPTHRPPPLPILGTCGCDFVTGRCNVYARTGSALEALVQRCGWNCRRISDGHRRWRRWPRLRRDFDLGGWQRRRRGQVRFSFLGVSFFFVWAKGEISPLFVGSLLRPSVRSFVGSFVRHRRLAAALILPDTNNLCIDFLERLFCFFPSRVFVLGNTALELTLPAQQHSSSSVVLLLSAYPLFSLEFVLYFRSHTSGG